MYNNEKIYSIELGEDLEIKTPPREQRVAIPASRVEPMSVPRAAKPTPGPRSAPKAKPQVDSKQPRGGLQFASLIVLTYVLGPFSVHLNPENRGRRGLLAAGMISGMACLGMFAGREFILDITGKGWPLWPLAVVGSLVMLTAFSVWSQAAYLAGRSNTAARHKLPSLLRKPWAVGIAGLVAPGLGLLLAGCARRGAAVIWAAWPVAGAVLMLSNAAQIWNRNQGVQVAAVPSALLEIGFMICAAVVVVGVIGWVVQALEGARQMMNEPGLGHRLRADWYAAALLVTLVGVAIAWDPPTVAKQMDNAAIILQEQGLRAIPLNLAKGAHRLDPGPLEYAVRVLELYEEMGRKGDAVRLREELDSNLAPYLALVSTENQGWDPHSYPGRISTQESKVVADLFGQAGSHRVARPNCQAQ